jgi:hypothetical protein
MTGSKTSPLRGRGAGADSVARPPTISLSQASGKFASKIDECFERGRWVFSARIIETERRHGLHPVLQNTG